MCIERWLPVVGFEGFIEVSDQGRLHSLDRVITVSSSRCSEPYQYVHKGILLKQSRNDSRGGYMYITLCGGGRIRPNAKVHHLVLEAFVGPRPPGTEGCHRNDVSDDNRLVNLRWDTQEANIRDAMVNGGRRPTHCPKKHEYTPENTVILKNPPGARRCRICAREWSRKTCARRRLAA